MASPPSWNLTPTQNARVQAIRSQNQGRFRSAAEVDDLHAAHLKRFLDVSLFAARIKREVKAMTDNQQRRDDAARREEQLREDAQRAAASAHGPGQAPSSPGQDGAPRAASKGQAQAAPPTTDASSSH